MTQTNAKATDCAASNTALKSQTTALQPMEAKIDWLTICFKIPGARRLDELIHTIQELLQVSIFFDTVRLNDNFHGRYKTYSGSLGITFSHSNFNCDDACNARITLPGQFLEQREPWHVKRVMRRLNEDFGGVCSRIDLAVDDYQKQLVHKTIETAIKDKQGIGFNCGKTVDSYGTNNDGITVYCGSRRSPKYARFYQKESFDRFEVEYKQSYASQIFIDYLADTDSTSSELLSSILKSSISFAFKPDKNLSRSVELDWWIAFRDRIVGAKKKFSVSKPRLSLDRTISWIHRNVSKSLLLMRQALGIELMNETLERWEYEARSRVTASDNDRLHQFNSRNFTAEQLIDMVQFA